MEVGDSVSGTLKKSFNEKVLPALKLAIAEERGSLEELVHTMILDSVEVCCIGKMYLYNKNKK